MPADLDAILREINDKVAANLAENGKWGPTRFVDGAPIYNFDPGDMSGLETFDRILIVARYGNWAGKAFGGSQVSSSFDISSYNFDNPEDVSRFRSDFFIYRNRELSVEDVPARNSLDAIGRAHDLLYRDANFEAAELIVAAIDAGRSVADLKVVQKQAIADEERNVAIADLWWIENSESVIADDPYGIILKNLADVAFAIRADYYFVQNLPPLSMDRLIGQVGEAFGSRLGKMIAGDDWFSQQLGSTVGGILGREASKLFTDQDFGASLLSVLNGTTSLTALVQKGFAELGVTADGISATSINKLASLLIAEAGEALGLEGLELYAFTETGQDLTAYLINQFASKGVLPDNEIATLLADGFDFIDLGNYLFDLALEFVANEFIGDLVESARGLVEIDSQAEALFAEAVSIIGSFIGNDLIPVLGSIIGETVGYILGSIVFEILDFITFGIFDDLFNEPEPQSWYFVGFDPLTNHLSIIHSDYKRDGAETAQVLQAYEANRKLTDAYLGYVNGIIDAIGATVDDGFFYPIVPDAEGNRIPGLDFRNHGMIAFFKNGFYADTYWGGSREARAISNDPETIISRAAAFELAHLIFYGGDLAQIRALNRWEAALNAQLPADLQPVYAATGNLATAPTDPNFTLLGANLQTAQEYRLYLDNAETINFLMAQAPESAFTIGWLATLARAAELGLNQAYVGSPDGGAGTAADDEILSADGNDLLFGNAGKDRIRSYGGDDTVYGGPGDDDIAGGYGVDLLAGDDGADSIDGGDGIDTIYGGEGNDRLNGGRGDDLVLGDSGDDELAGGIGRDRLFGYRGDDVIRGGSDGDEIAGEEGNDRLYGEDGADILYGDIDGAAGRDLIEGGAGDDLARGGGDNDDLDGGDGADRLYGDDGDDEVEGGAGADRLFGGAGVDRLQGGDGDDRVLGDSGNDTIAGGLGADLLYGLADDDAIDGGAGNDQVFGDSGNDTLAGGDGDDLLGGWSGADTAEGGAGNDRIAGEDGADRLNGGSGDDIIHGDRAPEPALEGSTAQQVIDAARARIGAGDFGILYQGSAYSYDGLRASDHDLLIVNPASSAVPTAVNSEVLWLNTEVDGIEAAGKRLVAYLNLAKIGASSLSWEQGWTDTGRADGQPTAAGSFLAAYEGNSIRLVNFWEPAWRAVLVERIETIVDQGFSGLFLDDVLEYFTRRGATDPARAQAAREMRDLIIDLARVAHDLVEARSGAAAADAFTIIVNGAPFLIQDTTADQSAPDADRAQAFYASIDAFLAENYFSQQLDYAVVQAVAEYGSRGIALLSVDTEIVTDQQRIAIERAASAAGFLPEVVPDADYGYDTARFAPDFGDHPAPGNDLLFSGDGADQLFGGAGNDGLYFGAHFGGGDVADGGDDTDTLALQGNYSDLLLAGMSRIEVLLLASGADTRFGDSGGNTYAYRITAPDAVVAPGATLTIVATDLRPAETLVFDGSGETDGAFRIFAGQGMDSLTGGAGSDGFFFGADMNLAASDRVVGGAGIDSLALRGDYSGARAIRFIDGSFTGIEVLTLLSGLRNEFGGPIVATGFDYDLTLADGNIAAGQRLDVIAGTLGPDESLIFDARTELDGTVRVFAGAGADVVFGSVGNDTLYGGLGADRLNGGAGADIYVYRSALESTASARDTIQFGAGHRIDLSLIDAKAGTGANEAFAFIGAGAFSQKAGELRVVQDGAQWLVEGDVDGDGTADLIIAVVAPTPITVSDLIL